MWGNLHFMPFLESLFIWQWCWWRSLEPGLQHRSLGTCSKRNSDFHKPWSSFNTIGNSKSFCQCQSQKGAFFILHPFPSSSSPSPNPTVWWLMMNLQFFRQLLQLQFQCFTVIFIPQIIYIYMYIYLIWITKPALDCVPQTRTLKRNEEGGNVKMWDLQEGIWVTFWSC